MANKLCVFRNIPADKEVIKVQLPFATDGGELTFHQGDQLVAEDIVSTTDEGDDVYKGTLVTNAATDETVIIFNQGVYKDEFGNRHGYVANPTLITYKSGEIITCVRASKNVKLQVSVDAIDGTPAVGKYLVPQVATEGTEGTYRLKVSATKTGVTAYKIENITSTIAVGRNFIVCPILRTM